MANRNAGTPLQRLEAKLDGVTSTEDKIKALAVLTVESIVRMGFSELKKVAGLVDFDPANHTKPSLLAAMVLAQAFVNRNAKEARIVAHNLDLNLRLLNKHPIYIVEG